MSHCGGELLREVHGVPADKIDFIPHGIPTLPSSRASTATHVTGRMEELNDRMAVITSGAAAQATTFQLKHKKSGGK